MKIYNPKARKRFGQNFLHDESVISQIIKAVNPKSAQHIIEIGPGLGALTKHLLASNAQVSAIELDRELIPHLLLHFGLQANFSLHEADALQFNFADVLTRISKQDANSQLNSTNCIVSDKQNRKLYANKSELLNVDTADIVANNFASATNYQNLNTANKLRIVGNLPYNISTALIFHLLQQVNVIFDMHFMLQKEVVDRLAATNKMPNFGRLSVMVQYFCKVEKLFEVMPHAFNPQPKVTSAIVRLVPYQDIPYKAHDLAIFTNLVKQAFSQKRKTLRNCLKNMVSDAIFSKAQIDPSLRAEKLSIEQFVSLANLLVS